MPAAELPATEHERLVALHAYEILDTGPDTSFDEIVALAARLTDSPIAAVSLLDADRQWLKAAHGLDMSEGPRGLAFCAHAILHPHEPLVVPDATRDVRFADNPAVTGAPHIRSYLGVPLLTPEGHALGSLCIADHRPREHDAGTIATMRSLANAVARHLDLHRALRSMTRAALTDPLTGLPNRRALLDELEGMLGAGRPAAILTLDLDRFKEANDVHGHAAGDALLREVAARLRAALRPGDVTGRRGSDEFVVLLRDVASEAVAVAVTERLRAALQRPVMHGGRALGLGATFGLALAPGGARTSAELLRAADEAMMRAKRERRGSIGCATAGDARRIQREAAATAALRRAIRDRPPELTAHLQPIVCARSGQVHAVEALARWQDAALGTIEPDEMFRTAARAGLEVRLCEQVRDAALAVYARLRARGLPIGRLALNLSAAELLGESVVDRLERQVEAAGLGLGAISIEITEDALLERVAHTTLARLEDLRRRGVRLGLDDFGTGTSGLAQLLQLPLDEIKLDRAFTRRLNTDGRAERIIEGAIRLAQGMDLAVVAEGVEDAAQARVLRGLGCQMLQGWLIAPALPETDLRNWLIAREQPGVVVPLRATG